jgi:hypothetical protein
LGRWTVLQKNHNISQIAVVIYFLAYQNKFLSDTVHVDSWLSVALLALGILNLLQWQICKFLHRALMFFCDLQHCFSLTFTFLQARFNGIGCNWYPWCIVGPPFEIANN